MSLWNLLHEISSLSLSHTHTHTSSINLHHPTSHARKPPQNHHAPSLPFPRLWFSTHAATGLTWTRGHQCIVMILERINESDISLTCQLNRGTQKNSQMLTFPLPHLASVCGHFHELVHALGTLQQYYLLFNWTNLGRGCNQFTLETRWTAFSLT